MPLTLLGMDTLAASASLRSLVLASLSAASAGLDEHGCGGVVVPRVPCLYLGVPERW